MYSKIEYGKAGDEVKVVSEHGDMVIVEALFGERYATKMENLINDKKIKNHENLQG